MTSNTAPRVKALTALRTWIWEQIEKHGDDLVASKPVFDLVLNKIDEFAALEPQEADTFQQRVQPWMMACFGPEISADRVERGDRLLEEVFELLQSGGYDPARVLPLRNYVWSRNVGEPSQEAGGVQVTLAAYCLAHGLDMHTAGETELARIWTKVEQIRAKQAAKPKHSPLPAAPVPASEKAAAITDAMVERAYDAFTRSFSSSPIGTNNTRRDLRAALEAALGSHPVQGWQTMDSALRKAIEFIEASSGEALGIAMSGSNHPNPDEVLMERFRAASSLISELRGALAAAPKAPAGPSTMRELVERAQHLVPPMYITWHASAKAAIAAAPLPAGPSSKETAAGGAEAMVEAAARVITANEYGLAEGEPDHSRDDWINENWPQRAEYAREILAAARHINLATGDQ